MKTPIGRKYIDINRPEFIIIPTNYVSVGGHIYFKVDYYLNGKKKNRDVCSIRYFRKNITRLTEYKKQKQELNI